MYAATSVTQWYEHTSFKKNHLSLFFRYDLERTIVLLLTNEANTKQITTIITIPTEFIEYC